MSEPISELLNTIDQLTQTYTINGYAALVKSITLPATLTITAYIAFVGWSTLHGWSQLTIGQATKHVLKIAIAFALATQWDVFSTYIYNVLTNGPNELSAILMQAAGNSSDDVNAALQDAFNQGISIGEQLWQHGGLHALSYYLIAVVVWTLNFFVSGIALLELVTAKCGLAITLVLAPVFCLCLIWEASRGIFHSWLRVALGFSLVPLILSAVLLVIDQVLSIGLDAMSNAIKSSHPTIDATATFVLGSIASIGLLVRAPQIAASIAGGMAVHGLDAASGIMRQLDKYSGLQGLRRMAANKITDKLSGKRKQAFPSAIVRK